MPSSPGWTTAAARSPASAKAEAEARQAYIDARRSASPPPRRKTAAKLDKAVLAELAPLKLEKARFATRLERLAEPQWGPTGQDRIAFEVATNPGSGAGAHRAHRLGRRAGAFPARPQGRARRARAAPPPWSSTRSTAASAAPRRRPWASGWRGSRRSRQLLVVTHSPQVAAQATHHWRVEKSSGKAGSLTGVVALDGPARREEIARMLSGATVSDEARAAADRLMAAGGGA